MPEEDGSKGAPGVQPRGLSSEDLLRQARERFAGLGDTDSPAEPDLTSDGASPEPPAADPPAPYAAAPPPIPPLPPVAGASPTGSLPATPPPDVAPKRKLPSRPMLLAAGALAFAAVVFFAGRGQTSGDDLGVGDCFEIPEDFEFTTVTNQPCDEPHEAQVYAAIDTGITLGDRDASDSECIDALIPLINNYALPEDFNMASIDGESSDEWLCVLTSPSGALMGSILPAG